MSKSLKFPEINCRHFSPSVDRKSLFSGRMRFHQSWYRHHRLEMPPGPNPAAKGAIYGNLLTLEDGYQGENFLTPEIFQQAQRRFPFPRKRQKSVRLYHNLLGSQTMCFNLFGPLIDQEIATPLLRLLPGFPQAVIVTRIKIEYAPQKEDHLNDLTSFDAFIEYQYPDGNLGFIGIETKLSEPFSQKKYSFNKRYNRWMTKGNWWWKPESWLRRQTKISGAASSP